MDKILDQPEWFSKAIALDHTSGFAEVNGARIHYLEWGKSNPQSVIMVHGNGAHAHWFEFVGAMLSDKYHFVTMSFSGMGDSDWRSNYIRETFINDLWGVVEATNLKNPVVVGHSFGGMISLATAGKYSHLMSGLLLVDFVVTPVEKHVEWFDNWPGSKPPRLADTKKELIDRFRLMPAQECKNQYLLDYIAEKSIRETNGSYSWKFDPTTYDNLRIGKDHIEILDNLKCPVGFMYGENTVEFDAQVSVEEMEQFLPEGSPVLCLKDAQHHLMLDQPEEFIKELDFLIQKLT